MSEWMNRVLILLLLGISAYQLSGFIEGNQIEQAYLSQEGAVVSDMKEEEIFSASRELTPPLELAALFAYREAQPVKQVPVPTIVEAPPVQVIENPRWLSFLGKVTIKNAESEYVFRNGRTNSVLNLTVGNEQAGILLISVENGEFKLRTDEAEIIIK